MNILLVTMEMQVGGAETHVLELAKELKRRKNNVYVMSAGGKFVELLEEKDIVHIVAPLKDKKPWNMVRSYFLMKKVIEKYQIQVVHAHARIPAFIAFKVCGRMHIPFVTTVHGIYKVTPVLKMLTNWGDKTLAVSEDIKKQIVRDYHLNPNNVLVTVNGIDTEEFKADKKKKQNDVFRIIHVSRLDKESSNVAKMLVESFTQLKEKISDTIELYIVGDGDFYEAIKEIATAEKEIKMLGLRTDVAPLLKSSDVFVGVSRAALEAMACELPTILAGNKEYHQGFIGIFDASKKEQAMATNFCCRDCEEVTREKIIENILKVYQMTMAERKEIGQYGRSIVKENYSIEKMVNDAEKMYQMF